MIDKKEVEYIANLARLEVSEKEAKKFTSQLGVILEHVAKISEIGTKEIKPTSHAVEINNVLREDKVDNEVSKEESLSNAPDSEEGAFKVPRII